MNPLADLLLSTARRDPARPLVRSAGATVWTHGDLDALSARLAHVLVERGVRPGDRLAVQEGKSREILALHLAAVRVGAVYVPLNSGYTDAELAGLVGDAEPALLVRETALDLMVPHARLAELLSRAGDRSTSFDDVPRDGSDPAAMLYTSGTTGRPKGAVLSQENLVFNATVLTEAWGFGDDDVLLHILPLFHTHGLFVAAYCSIVAGGSMVLVDHFTPDAVLQELPRCTVMMGVPTHYSRLLSDNRFTRATTAGVRLFTSGSAPMLVSVHDEFRERTGHTILERYGMTETCILTSNPLHGERRPGTVGPPLPGVGLRIDGASPGSIEVSGPNVFNGYWRRPELRETEFTADGWFRTGDIGRIDDDGYVEIMGRSKDLVITGGLNVYPKEVELVLDSLPGVLESAVVGLPDPDFGEAVTAALVAAPGSTVDPELLRTQAREQLAAFKVPKRIVVLDELPRNTMGKVEKTRLRADLPALLAERA